MAKPSLTAIHPRVLVVDDEYDTRFLMDLALKNAFSTGRTAAFALTTNEASAWLRTRPFHLMSLDMRVPRMEGGPVNTSTGASFARFSEIAHTLAKNIIFSASIDAESASDQPGEAMMISSLPINDKYGKSGRSKSPTSEFPFESLSTQDWANRIAEYNNTRGREIDTPGGRRSSVVGAWLEMAPRSLPPVLARLAANLSQHWDRRDSTRVEAAQRFIETCAHLALAQTAVVLAREGVPSRDLAAPDTWPQAAALDTLRRWRTEHADAFGRCNWSNWLTADTVSALDIGRLRRNERAHSLTLVRPAQDWQAIYEPLRYAMDLAGYWALHPLCLDVTRTRDGMRAQTMASTETPLPFRMLDADIVFPQNAEQDDKNCWQALWRCQSGALPIDQNTPPVWEPAPANWDGWIRREPSGAVWLRLWTRGSASEWIDLVSSAREKR